MRPFKKSEMFLSLAGFVFVFLCVEIAARIWLNYFARPEQYLKYALYTENDPKRLRFQPHHYLNYVLTPGYHLGRTSHNSLGFRGQEFPKAKPTGEFRIVAIGGSTTYDETIADDNDIHTKQLENILHTQYAYQSVRVVNAGIPSYNSWESLINLEFRVLDIEPDVIILFDNNNDVHARLINPLQYKSDNSGLRKQWTCPPVPWWERSVSLRTLSRSFHVTRQVDLEDCVSRGSGYGEHPMKTLEQNPPIYFERNLRNMVAIAKEHGITPLLVTYAYSPYFQDNYPSRPFYQKGFEEHNDIIKRVAKSHAVPLFDLEAVMPKDKEYYDDGRHNNAKGARKKAELYAEFLTSHNLLPKK